MRLTVTSMEKSSTEILTHFTCKEGTYIGIFILKMVSLIYFIVSEINILIKFR